jgi:hypothetical protein
MRRAAGYGILVVLLGLWFTGMALDMGLAQAFAGLIIAALIVGAVILAVELIS